MRSKVERPDNRLILPFFLYALMFAYVIYGLFKTQVFDREQHLATLDQLLGRSVYERGLRGTIYSIDGVKLAWSERAPVLSMKSLDEKGEEKLKNILTEEQIAVLRNTGEVQVSWEQAFFLRNAGFETKVKELRKSYGFVYHLVGNVNVDGDGVSGLELVYNDVLKGRTGLMYEIRTPGGGYRQSIVQTQPEDGLELQTTIHFGLQKFVADLLTTESTPSVAIVSEVKTGNILAMVSFPFPDFDMNGIDNITWKKVLNDPLRPLLNRAISSTYPPGSIFKVVPAIAQILYDDSSRVVQCGGIFRYRDSKGRVTGRYKDWYLPGHGPVSLKKALRVSCNVYFYNVGLDVGIDKMVEVARALKLGEKTGVSLPGEVSGTLPDPDWKLKNIGEKWYPGDTILFSIGQGYINLTPLQMLTLYNTIANRGIRTTPKLLLNEEVKQEPINLELSKEQWDIIIDGLTEVTTVLGSPANAGTAAKAFRGFPIKVAGKTGTAQTGKHTPHAWFVGFAPVEDPKYSVLVLVENGGSGGEVAAPLARKIFDYMLREGFFSESPDKREEKDVRK
ncbi:penicillin-binding transpeptidase domain-containing protein [Fervidobacterium thailandense]|uniref:Peptidoglycan glycosyltransferase n=1 Tax=Fervidobacterium thailandense TaxID=1008305 RepID=A0A1E3G339_9BACT|nr:penicillin-binding transpeptidase domain-containing protein [Fervidobacterium thailandense]ODN30582.1 peptidoglycan glycosyltransferase [Fervidobacterium thailandense]